MGRKKKKESLLDQTTDWYESTSPRVRAIFVGGACLLAALFLILVTFDAAGSFGRMVYEYLFMTKSGDPALLGWGFVILILFLSTFGLYLCFVKEPISYIRLILGGVFALISLNILFSAGADEAAGGALGSLFFNSMHDLLGVFSYVLMPLGLLGALYILKLFSPIAIWGWINDIDLPYLTRDKDGEKEDEDENEEEEEEEEDDEDEEDEENEEDEEDEDGGG